MSDWQIIDLKSSTSEADLRSTSPGKMRWQTQHSADFGNWVSIKALLSQKEMCHTAKSSFFDAVCLVSFGLQDFGSEKEKHRVGRHLKGYLWCKSSHIFGWTSNYNWLEYREEAAPVVILNSQKENAQRASVMCCFTDCAIMQGRENKTNKQKKIYFYFFLSFFFKKGVSSSRYCCDLTIS